MSTKYTYVGNLRISNRVLEKFVPSHGFTVQPRETIIRYLREHGPVTKEQMLKYFQHVMNADDINPALDGLKNDGLADSYRQPTRTKPTTIWRLTTKNGEL